MNKELIKLALWILFLCGCIVSWIICVQVFAYDRGDPMVREAQRKSDKQREYEGLIRQSIVQAEWADAYRGVSERMGEKLFILPNFKKGLNKEFLFWLAEEAQDYDTNLYVFANCWHGWGTEVSYHDNWMKICLKYDKTSGAYRPVDEKMKKEYEEAMW